MIRHGSTLGEVAWWRLGYWKGLQKKVAESPRSPLSPAHVLLQNLTMTAHGKRRWQRMLLHTISPKSSHSLRMLHVTDVFWASWIYRLTVRMSSSYLWVIAVVILTQGFWGMLAKGEGWVIHLAFTSEFSGRSAQCKHTCTLRKWLGNLEQN